LGLTWEKVGNDIGTVRSVGVWVTRTPASPTPGAITVAYAAGQTGIGWVVFDVAFSDISGANAVASIVQSRIGTPGAGTSTTISFSTPSLPSDLTLGAFNMANGSEDVVPDSPGIEIGEARMLTPNQTTESSYALGGVNTLGWSWTTSVTPRTMIIEIKAASQAVQGIGSGPAPARVRA